MAGLGVSQPYGHSCWKQWWRRLPNTCSKKILLLLMWQVLFTFSWSILSYTRHEDLNDDFLFIVKFLAFCCAPVVGWFADVKFGRYEVVKFGSMASFSASIFYFFALVVNGALSKYLFSAAIFVCSFTVACYLAAIIPFLTDQLIGATSNDLSTVLCWYYWAENFGYGLSDLYNKYTSIGTTVAIVFAISLAVIIISDCLCQQWLDRTHKVTNPIKLITQVLNYTRKHKYPERRSAFTFIDQEQPIRIDYGKIKFGGPFTEEEVEDVKTLLRLLPLLLCLNLFICASETSSTTILPSNGVASFSGNLRLGIWPFALLLIPLQQFLNRCVCKISLSMLNCINAGLFISTVGYMLVSATEVYGVILSEDLPRYLSCQALNDSLRPDSRVDWYWKIAPFLLGGTGKTILYVLHLQFIIAQSPDKMKGLVIGTMLACRGIVLLIIIKVLKFHFTLCCDLLILLLLISLFLVFLVLSKCYTLRERNREINIQAIVEEHYERYMDQEEEYMRQHPNNYYRSIEN